MTLVDRHVARQFVVTLAVVTTTLIALVVLIHLFTNLENLEAAKVAFAERGLSTFAGMCRLYALLLPFYLPQFGPLTLALSAAWTIARLHRDTEMQAARVTGIPERRVLAPIVVIGALVGIGLGVVRIELLPRIAPQKVEMERMLRGKSRLVLEGPMVVVDGRGRFVSVRSYEPTTGLARQVTVIPRDGEGRTHVAELRWDPEGPKGRGWYPQTPVVGTLPFPEGTDFTPDDLEIDNRGTRHLLAHELEGLRARNPERPDLRVMAAVRGAAPWVPLALLLLIVPLVTRLGRTHAMMAVGITLGITLSYFALERFLLELAERNATVDPGFAVWAPLLACASFGLLLWNDA